MLQIKVKVNGIKELIEKNNKVIKAIDNGEFEEEVMKRVVNRAKYRAPRKKGLLVQRIKGIKISNRSFRVICDAVNKYGVPYPEFLEHGTRYIKVGTKESPRVIRSSSGKTAFLPFLAWSVWRTQQELQKIFRDKIIKKYK